MKYFFEGILFTYFVAALANSTVKPAKTNNDKEKARCFVNNNIYSGPNCEKIEQQLDEMKKQISELKENQTNCSGKNGQFSELKQHLAEIKQEIRALRENVTRVPCSKVYKNCADVYHSGCKSSGVYKINPDGLGEFDVFCDQKTAGGGWTVFQKRQDGSVDFYRGWCDYKRGFGNLNGEFWLGLEKIHRLTANSSDKLRVDLEDINSKTSFAEYSSFDVASESSKYQLSFGSFSGTTKDSLGSHHNGHSFTTKDRDNDNSGNNCASYYKGAWWYNNCYNSNLNGLYFPGKNRYQGMVWYQRGSLSGFIKKSEMKIRPKDF